LRSGLLSGTGEPANQLPATTTVFDERDLPYQTTDAESRVTRLNYQPNGTLAQVIDGNGHSTGYAPDDFDRLKILTHADSTTEQFLYDPTSNLTRKTTRAAQPINFTYDDRSRLRSRASPSETATFLYDLGGRMTHAQNSAATLDFGYDARDQLKTETTNIPGLATQIVQHDYDPAGNRTRLTYPDGVYVDYVYDELNRLEILRDDHAVDQVTYVYDELSRIHTMLRASGVLSTFAYDRASRVKTISHDSPTAGVLEALTYDYNPNGTIQHMTDHNGLHVFGYDHTQQLTSVDYPSASPFPDITYNYDGAGNRLSTVTSAGTVAYVPNALNEYTSVGGVSQTYDSNGNLTADGTNTYTFDAENRMVSAGTPSGAATYSYDPFMRRTKKTLTGVTNYFLWTGSTLLSEYDGVPTRSVRYVRDRSLSPVQVGYGPGLSEPRHDAHVDHLETLRTMSDPSGAASWGSNFDAFRGALPSILGVVTVAARLPGHESDGETGLDYSRARYYSPGAGRFVGPDPLGQMAERVSLSTARLNGYQYAYDNPTGLLDPFGLETVVITVRSWGVGSHSAVYADHGVDDQPMLYDPAGSYSPPSGEPRGSGDSFSGSDADVAAYRRYHESTGDTVEMTVLPTTAAQERAIAARAEELGGVQPFQCTAAVSSAIGGVCGIGNHVLPGFLADDAKHAAQSGQCRAK
jgi:RHS repeat-associated protein